MASIRSRSSLHPHVHSGTGLNAEIATVRGLLAMIPEDLVIDRASLTSRIENLQARLRKCEDSEAPPRHVVGCGPQHVQQVDRIGLTHGSTIPPTDRHASAQMPAPGPTV